MGEAESPRSDVHVLVTAGSKHGATAEIAEHIGGALAKHGIEVTVAQPEQATSLEDYHAVVLGSAVYAGHWQKEAIRLAERIGAADPRPLVWLFSSGPIGEPPKPEEDPVDIEVISNTTSAREHRVFAGKIDRSKLSLGERAIVTALRAPEGDYRNWEEITAWAEGIAGILDAGR